ncbi:MAG: hypothetical protein QM760_07580 [Nibricoccus sp.]
MNVFRGLFCLLLCVGLAGCLEMKVTVKEHAAFPSPDGKLVARLVIVDAGATTSRGQMVLITPPGIKIDETTELSPYRAASIDRCADKDISVKWDGSSAVRINFSQFSPSWIGYVPEIQGVKIRLEDANASAK